MAALADWLFNALSALMQWIYDVLIYIPSYVYSAFVDGIETILASPYFQFTWADNLSGYLSAISGPVLWFLSLFEVGYGASVVTSALIAKFILRRIPGIG